MRISSLSLATIHYYFNSLIKENATPKKHLNYCGIQVGPSKKISDEEEGHHILQELPVKAHQPPPPLPPHERTPS